MNKNSVLQDIEKLINEEQDDLDLSVYAVPETAPASEKFLYRTVLRLVKNYKKYAAGQVGVSDYLAALRNFLMTFKMPIRIDDPAFLEGNHFGIYEFGDESKYMASLNLPDYVINKLFVTDVFKADQSSVVSTKNEYSLQMNPFIERLTGFKYFKSFEQKLSVYGAMNTPEGYTSLICMATGGGKSLISQSVAYQSKGLTVVVVPTVSLAIDQVKVAKATIQHDTDAEIFCYYGGIHNPQKIYNAIENQTARLLFISPEALMKNSNFKQLIADANSTGYLKNLIIDEAHIVIEWGDLFRVDYQILEPWRTGLMHLNPTLRTFLLSATFEDRTVKSLRSMFSESGKWIEIRCDALRKEPRFIYIKANGYTDKQKKIMTLVNNLPHPMIVYVNSPDEAKKLREKLKRANYQNIQMYTGDTKSSDREKLIKEWTADQFDIMIATSAFGVGVDKPDVRSVLHVYIPESPDTYYQELGRGGRDGLPSLSVMCVFPDEDITTAINKFSKVLTTAKFVGRWWTMFQNPGNLWGSNQQIVIDTSVKPDYDYLGQFVRGNKADEKWNINVLLLLRRFNKIVIDAIDEANGVYNITIRILDNALTEKNEKLDELFETIRNDEAGYANQTFGLMRKAIQYADTQCWSDMFTATYPLVSEYCAGCNAHNQIQYDFKQQFPLLEAVRGPKREISQTIKKHFGNTRELLLKVSENISDTELMDYLEMYDVSVVVCDNELTIDNTDREYDQLYKTNFKEFNELIKYDNHFYVSGVVAVIYTDAEHIDSEYKVVQKYLKKDKEYLIHIVGDDWYLGSRKKNISEAVDGALIRL